MSDQSVGLPLPGNLMEDVNRLEAQLAEAQRRELVLVEALKTPILLPNNRVVCRSCEYRWFTWQAEAHKPNCLVLREVGALEEVPLGVPLSVRVLSPQVPMAHVLGTALEALPDAPRGVTGGE